MYNYYISAGSNQGDSRAYLEEALASLQKDLAIEVKSIASMIETRPWGYTKQANFLNTLWIIQSKLGPELMLAKLQALENEAGRARNIHWGPRTLDLDIVYALKEGKELVYGSDDLIVPHPYFWDRLFVLEPLAELVPYFTYKGQLISERIEALQKELGHGNTDEKENT